MKKIISLVLVAVMTLTSTSMVFGMEFEQEVLTDNGIITETVDIIFEGYEEAPNYYDTTVPLTFNESFLFGNGSFGHADGSQWDSSVGMVWSMVADNSDNIWFIDQDVSYLGMGGKWTGMGGHVTMYHERTKYVGQYLRKYNTSTGQVETIQDLSKLRIKYKGQDKKVHSLTDFRAYKLVHNPNTDKIYLSGKFTKDYGTKAYTGFLLQVSPTFKAVAGDGGFDKMFGATDFAFVDDNDNVIYSRKEVHNFMVNRIREKGQAVSFTNTLGYCNYNDVMEAVLMDNYLYVLRMNVEDTRLTRYNIQTGEWELVEKFAGKFSSISVQGKEFLACKDGDYSLIHLDGGIELLCKSENVNVEGQKANPKLMVVLSDNSIVAYDQAKGMFTKIERIGEPIEEDYTDLGW